MATLADALRQTGYAQDGTLGTPAPVNSPMTTALAEHIKSIPQKFNENQQHQMDLLVRAYPGNTFKSMMLEGDPAAMNELAMQAPIVGMMAYHGTPHKILDKFDISKVGTGEGAQAYGHGMYFAENPAVAKEYQTALSRKSPEAVKYMNELSKSEDKASQVAATTLQNFDHPNQAIDELKANLKNKNTPKEYVSIYESAIKKLENTPASGNLYKVDIPDEHIPNMLDWDKPLAQQNKQVLEGLKKLNDPYINKAISSQPKLSKDGEYWEYMGNTYGSKSEALEDATPQRIISGYTNIGKTPEEVSKALNNTGIKGVSYLDQGSRIEGQGSRNFVVFDPSTVKILEENAKPVSRKALIEEQVKALKE